MVNARYGPKDPWNGHQDHPCDGEPNRVLCFRQGDVQDEEGSAGEEDEEEEAGDEPDADVTAPPLAGSHRSCGGRWDLIGAAGELQFD